MNYRIVLMSLLFLSLISCNKDDNPLPLPDTDFKEEMRDFVIGLSQYAKSNHPNFLVVPQNGIELITEDGQEGSPLHNAYLNAIDAHGQEDLFYGYNKDDKASPDKETTYLQLYLDQSLSVGKSILVTDYCSTPSNMDDSYNQNQAAGYISFAADERELFNIPDYPNPIRGENNAVITEIGQAKNFLYLINPGNFSSKSTFIQAVKSSNYDLLIMDLFFDEVLSFTATELEQLKEKANGGKRLVICYMSIGEAEDYRYYWQSDWNSNKPDWMEAENPNWEGNYKVRYWESGWQDIIYGNDNSYLKKVLDAGFDGVYLDIIDAFEYFE
ncbi:MAG: endo alpha-1,4 polygalactosaminidase [Saprospiraceae bacterium]|nr:endo alpha-1,4 polygalactosaminidase [Saprospiraceae bacterium]